jgi:hypothetical protein
MVRDMAQSSRELFKAMLQNMRAGSEDTYEPRPEMVTPLIPPIETHAC